MGNAERFWLDSYSAGVPSDIEPKQYSSVVDLVSRAVHEYPDRPAFASFGHTITFSEFDTLSRQFAAWLVNEGGLARGARVGIMLPNIIQYPVALFGALRAGLVVVNIDPMYTARELAHQLSDSGAELVLTLENFAHVVEQALPQTVVKRVITTRVGDLLAAPRSWMINAVVKYVRRSVPAWQIPHAISFDTVLEKGQSAASEDAEIQLDDTAFLQYTGGTTGVSRGAILSHRNIVANVLQGMAWTTGRYERGREISITALPLYHIFSLTASCIFTMSIGGLNVLIADPRDLKGFVRELKKRPFTFMVGVNTLFRGLLGTGRLSTVDFSHLKVTLAGGMAVTREVAEAWQRETGCTMLQAYGLTEAAPAVCMNPIDMDAFNGRVGLPVPSTYLQIRDEHETDVGIDAPGELCLTGPQLTTGYWNRPQESMELFTSDGWLKTGDYAEINAEGFVKLLDRKKDLIIVSGFNVYPNEVEAVADAHPGILESAAIGVPDEKSGEVVKLFVVAGQDKPSVDELKAYFRNNLTGYKRPRAFEFRDTLPHSNVGKILRRDLRIDS